MSRSKDLLDVINSPVFYINWKELTIDEEILIPSCSNHCTWYSYKNDFYLMESDLFDSKIEAAEFLLGCLINYRKNDINRFKNVEKELIDLIAPDVDDTLIG